MASSKGLTAIYCKPLTSLAPIWDRPTTLEAAMGPLLSTLQQIQTSGVADPFRSEPRLAAFGEFLMNLLTPPEQRFGGTRKLVSIGDAAAESTELFGQLGTAFNEVNPDLSARLMWSWLRNGRLHSGFHGTTILKIDETLAARDPQLGDAAFPGWYTVLRNGWGTPDETAIWFVNGDFYCDHSHEDNGNVVVYALGAPGRGLGQHVYPVLLGALMHNAPVPESKLPTSPPVAWDGEAHLESIGFRWQEAAQESFESFAHGSYSRAAFHSVDSTWKREVYSIHPDPTLPVVVIRDEFSGAGAIAPRILSLNVMAAGQVETPFGAVGVPSPAHPFGPELNRFGFAGIPQAGRVAIDADVYAGGATQYALGHWAHHWVPNYEDGEFRHANGGKPFEEAQHILKLRGAGGFLLVFCRIVTTRQERNRCPKTAIPSRYGLATKFSHGARIRGVFQDLKGRAWRSLGKPT